MAQSNKFYHEEKNKERVVKKDREGIRKDIKKDIKPLLKNKFNSLDSINKNILEIQEEELKKLKEEKQAELEYLKNIQEIKERLPNFNAVNIDNTKDNIKDNMNNIANALNSLDPEQRKYLLNFLDQILISLQGLSLTFDNLQETLLEMDNKVKKVSDKIKRYDTNKLKIKEDSIFKLDKINDNIKLAELLKEKEFAEQLTNYFLYHISKKNKKEKFKNKTIKKIFKKVLNKTKVVFKVIYRVFYKWFDNLTDSFLKILENIDNGLYNSFDTATTKLFSCFIKEKENEKEGELKNEKTNKRINRRINRRANRRTSRKITQEDFNSSSEIKNNSDTSFQNITSQNVAIHQNSYYQITLSGNKKITDEERKEKDLQKRIEERNRNITRNKEKLKRNQKMEKK